MRQFNYPGTEGWPASFSLNGQIYHANLDSTPAFYITSGTWSECGMSCGGFGYELVPLSQDFLVLMYYGGLVVFRYDSNGNREIPFGGSYNPLTASMAALSDSSFMATWFHVQRDSSDLLASGVYVYRLTTDNGFSVTRKMILLR